MRKILASVALLVVAALIALAILRRGEHAPGIAGALESASSQATRTEAIGAELATQPDPNESRAMLAPDVSVSPSEPRAPMAHLKIGVIGRTTQRPLEGVEISVHGPYQDYSSATLDVAPAIDTKRGKTDVHGTIALDVPAGIVLCVDASVQDRSGAFAEVLVPGLDAGAEREITAELPDGDDAHVFGRVLAADTRAALGGAKVTCIDARPGFSSDGSHWGAVELAQVLTGSDGSFELDYPSWRDPHLRIEAQGFGMMLSEPLAECTDAAHPLVIELQRSSSLRAHVLGADGRPCDALRVELIIEGTELIPSDQQNRGDGRADFPNETWSAKTDRAGWISFADLPAQVPIAIYLHMGARIVQPADKSVRLEPGEAREVEWHMGAGCAISGLVIDNDGKPVPRTMLWLTGSWRASSPYFSRDSRSMLQQVETTDKDGRFEMVGVPPGAWFLGPAPEDPRITTDSSIAAVAMLVVVGPERSKEVTLQVQRGLFIRGKVLDPDGKPVSGSQIELADDAREWLDLSCMSDSDGSFRVGPLPRRAITLTANGYSRFMNSLPVRASAGAADIELKLRRGGKIRGRVVDAATGSSCVASLEFTVEGSATPERDWTLGGTEDDGSFESSPCESGSYSIGAMTEDGRFGLVKGIGVSIGDVHPDVLLSVSRGGSVRLLYQGSRKRVWGRILLDGIGVGETGSIEKGKPRLLGMPAGSSVLEIEASDGIRAQRKRIELQPGETREVVLTDED